MKIGDKVKIRGNNPINFYGQHCFKTDDTVMILNFIGNYHVNVEGYNRYGIINQSVLISDIKDLRDITQFRTNNDIVLYNKWKQEQEKY
jgi:hypothetical protein